MESKSVMLSSERFKVSKKRWSLSSKCCLGKKSSALLSCLVCGSLFLSSSSSGLKDSSYFSFCEVLFLAKLGGSSGSLVDCWGMGVKKRSNFQSIHQQEQKKIAQDILFTPSARILGAFPVTFRKRVELE